MINNVQQNGDSAAKCGKILKQLSAISYFRTLADMIYETMLLRKSKKVSSGYSHFKG